MPARRLVAATVAALSLLGGCSSDPDPASPPAAAGPDAQATSPGRAPSSPTSSAPSGAGGTPAPKRTLADAQFTLEPVVELEAPIALADRSGDERALYIAERGGRIVRVLDGAVGDTVLDIAAQTTTDGERGLLGLDFSDDGTRLYVSYTNTDGDSRLDEYQMDGDRADAGTRRTLLEVAQPYSNHNGGNVVTGPDGLLYYGLGDGGAAGDPHNHGQNLSTLLGALLRIDPAGDGGAAYRVPGDNPFVDVDDARPEIWVYGLRNPWRFSFDRRTDDLWIGDVGQGAVEEIDRLPFTQAGGANLGWRVFEGTQRFADGQAPDAVPPVFEYPHDGRCSVSGGYVYRGAQIAGLDGVYLYGDLCDGVLRGLVADGDDVVAERAFDVQVPELVGFGEDGDGELYALSLSGPVYRLAPAD